MSTTFVYDAVCVGAHPDDVEIGMGATVAKMCAAGRRVAIVDLTDGEPTPQGSPEIRAKESAEAARLLGVEDRRTLAGRNRYLFDTVQERTALAEVLRELRPRVLFLPYPDDAHPDHIAAAAIGRAARFYSKFTKTDMAGEPFYPARVLHYMAVHMRIAASPTFIVACEAELDRKIAALRAYRSQFETNAVNVGVIPAVERAGRHWGDLGGVGFGEAFFSMEPIALASPLEVL